MQTLGVLRHHEGMTSDLIAKLQHGILPLFRTRASDMWNWRAVDDYVDGAQQGIDDLAAAARVHGAAVVVPYVRKAIASTFRVLMRADDSNGSIKLVIDELLGLHAHLSLIEPTDTAKLVAWLDAFQFGEAGEYFGIDVIDYAIALGAGGLGRYRRRLARREAALSHPFVRGPQNFVNDNEWAVRHTLLHNYRRLAVLDRDEQQLVALYTGEHERSRDLLEGADALVEAGFPERAIELAHRGMRATAARSTNASARTAGSTCSSSSIRRRCVPRRRRCSTDGRRRRTLDDGRRRSGPRSGRGCVRLYSTGCARPRTN